MGINAITLGINSSQAGGGGGGVIPTPPTGDSEGLNPVYKARYSQGSLTSTTLIPSAHNPVNDGTVEMERVFSVGKPNRIAGICASGIILSNSIGNNGGFVSLHYTAKLTAKTARTEISIVHVKDAHDYADLVTQSSNKYKLLTTQLCVGNVGDIFDIDLDSGVYNPEGGGILAICVNSTGTELQLDEGVFNIDNYKFIGDGHDTLYNLAKGEVTFNSPVVVGSSSNPNAVGHYGYISFMLDNPDGGTIPDNTAYGVAQIGVDATGTPVGLRVQRKGATYDVYVYGGGVSKSVLGNVRLGTATTVCIYQQPSKSTIEYSIVDNKAAARVQSGVTSQGAFLRALGDSSNASKPPAKLVVTAVETPLYELDIRNGKDKWDFAYHGNAAIGDCGATAQNYDANNWIHVNAI